MSAVKRDNYKTRKEYRFAKKKAKRAEEAKNIHWVLPLAIAFTVFLFLGENILLCIGGAITIGIAAHVYAVFLRNQKSGASSRRARQSVEKWEVEKWEAARKR